MTLAARPNLRDLFQEHARYVWRCLRHLGVAEPDLEDVCQEVFLTAHRKLADFEGRSTPKTWLYGICLRTASDYRRRAYNRRERATSEPAALLELRGSQEHDAPGESRHLVQSLLSQLDPDKRDVLVLYEIEGFTMKEIAEMLGCPVQTAYSRLYAARELLLALVQGPGSRP